MGSSSAGTRGRIGCTSERLGGHRGPPGRPGRRVGRNLEGWPGRGKPLACWESNPGPEAGGGLARRCLGMLRAAPVQSPALVWRIARMPRDRAWTRACGSTGIRRYCGGVNDDRLPVETEPPISEELRQRGIDVLQGLLASGKVDLDRFQRALDGLLGARPQAEFDDWDVEIVVHITKMGSITVIAPRGLDVRQVGRSAAVNSTLEEPIPGYPVVRLSASCDDMGTIRLMHPEEKRQRRWGWRRRPSQATPRS